jgi:hypothetical protein
LFPLESMADGEHSFPLNVNRTEQG